MCEPTDWLATWRFSDLCCPMSPGIGSSPQATFKVSGYSWWMDDIKQRSWNSWPYCWNHSVYATLVWLMTGTHNWSSKVSQLIICQSSNRLSTRCSFFGINPCLTGSRAHSLTLTSSLTETWAWTYDGKPLRSACTALHFAWPLWTNRLINDGLTPGWRIVRRIHESPAGVRRSE